MSEEIPGAFYHRVDDDTFEATPLTRGPWDEGAQHAGPPSALAGWAIDHRPGARADLRVARISLDIMRPVPIGRLRVSTEVTHAGRNIETVTATVVDTTADRPVMRAGAVLVRVGEPVVPSHREAATIPSPVAFEATLTEFRFAMGYHRGMETRYVKGSFAQPGPATVWFRMARPLIAGEPVDPLSRVLIAADSGNGVSMVLDPRAYVFINPELTVHLHRQPVGEWVGLDAVTSIDPVGIGLADTALHDADGPIGRGSQSLFVAPRA
jgi:Acyl-CoA thioesterase C-terminal domain/Acyl-CoA thioesterase N-terminal domain